MIQHQSVQVQIKIILLAINLRGTSDNVCKSLICSVYLLWTLIKTFQLGVIQLQLMNKWVIIHIKSALLFDYSCLELFQDQMTRGNTGQSNFTLYNRSRRDKLLTNASNSQMFLFREIDSTIGQVFYMIDGRSLNERLWVRNP